MYTLGQKSLSNLTNVHPSLVLVVKSAIKLAAQDFSVVEGVRSIAKEKENIAKGVSKLKDPKSCLHCIQKDSFGHAVDLAPFVNGKPSDDWKYFYPIAAAMQNASRLFNVDLRWGGVWDRKLNELSENFELEVRRYVKRRTALKQPAFIDGFHFELPLVNNAGADGRFGGKIIS